MEAKVPIVTKNQRESDSSKGYLQTWVRFLKKGIDMIFESKQQLTFHPDFTDNYGIDVRYTKKTETLEFSGWFDGSVGIPGGQINFVDFCKKLGVKKSTLGKVLKEI